MTNPTPTPPAGAEPHNYATPPMPCTDGEGGPDLTDTLNNIASRAGAEPSPEARKGFGTPVIKSLRAELERVKGERDDHIKIALSCGQSTVEGLKQSLLREMHRNNQKDLPAGFDSWSAYHESIIKLRSDLSAAHDRIGELEKQVEQMKTRVHTGENSEDCPFCLTKTQTPGVPNPMCHLCDLESERDALHAQVKQDRATIAELKTHISTLHELLALANAKYEEARRAGVKTFDESHPDDLPARIHAVIKEHERLWLNGGYIYLSSYLAKAIFEMLNQPLK